jgi:phasin family protein
MATAKKTTAKAADPMEAALAAGKENAETLFKAGNAAAVETYEKAAAMTKEQVESAFKAGADTFKSVQGYEEVAAFNKQAFDAMFESGTVVVKGVQDLNKLWFGLAQATVEDGLDNTKKIFSCKNFEDLVELQAAFASKGYDKVVNDGQKISDLSMKVAEEAFQPFAGQFNAVVEKLTKPHVA